MSVAVVSTIEKDDVLWTSHKAACLALAALVGNHPGILEKLNVPTHRLAELVDSDVLNDTRRALMALVNLGLSGHAKSREKALELLDDADPYSRVSWREILGEATEEELESAIRRLLPQSVPRAKRVGNVTTFSGALFTPMFIKDWDLSASVRSEVARTLADALTDPKVGLHSRQASALVLGFKAELFVREDCELIVDALKDTLTQAFEADPTLLSIDNPLSMLRINVGQPEDVIAAAAEALLAFSPWIDGEEERRSLRREIERLRASQVETLGIGVADGFGNFVPKGVEEERWLLTRLLLLLNSQHARVRQGAARSLAVLIKRGAVAFDAELLDTILHLSTANHIGDRVAAAYTLSMMAQTSDWNHVQVAEALEALRRDLSFLVRRQVDGSL